ncbi:hypothetical protein R6Q59_001954 [Mikania micrantha]
MALSSSTNSRNLPLKLLLISVAVVSAAVMMKLAVPLMLNGLPAIWSVIVTWLKPPYLYVVINGIIIAIAASTRIQNEHHHENQSPSSDLPSELPLVSNPASFDIMEPSPVSYDVEPSVTVQPLVDADFETVAVSGPVTVGEDEDVFVTSRSTGNEVQPEVNFPVKEKQLVSSRFANNRKPAKPSPEGARALRVLKPRKHETLETTWKMITDGRQLPLTRHLRKSDTFDNLHHDHRPDELSPPAKTKAVKKSETFKDRTAYANQNDYPVPPATNLSPAAGGKLKKDVSLSHDELNRRVEAFIKKFNDDMRLQRQESLKQYMEMVGNR